MSDLEKQVATAVRAAVLDATKTALSNYNSPFAQLVHRVVNKQADALYDTLSTALDGLTDDAEFRAEVRAAFRGKVARRLLADVSGHTDKAYNELVKSDPRIKAKALLAIESIIAEASS